ncbi:MAG TPA: DUF2339 domain-containing protein, partial [Acidobacteriota bacterium]|nr:DUF2339 domain-containing protein [Acidobacteriota bacterium]
MEPLLYLFVVGFILLVPIAILVTLVRNSRRLNELQTQISPLSLACSRLERQQKELQNEVRALRALLQPSAAKAPPEPAPAEKPVVVAEVAPEPKPAPVVIPEKAVEPKPAPRPIPAPPPVVRPEQAAPQRTRPTQPPPSPPPPPPSGPSLRIPSFDWEGLVGVKLFSWIAGVALLLAAVFFLRYSIDRGWLMPPVRMAIGIFVGIGLLVLCELNAARRYPVTANAMDASAIAILFSTFFAARALWNLIDAVPAFILMVLVTAVAVLLSIRRDSMFIALLGLVGGFATPVLLSTGENKPIPLFSYLLLLNAGLAWVS